MQKKPKLKERKPMFNMKPKHKQMISNNHEQMQTKNTGTKIHTILIPKSAFYTYMVRAPKSRANESC